MKILRLYTRLPPLPGGMENHIAQLTREQIELGHNVSIYFNQGSCVTSNDVQVTKLPLYKIKPQFIGLLIFHFLVLIRLFVNRDKFDIVHIHGDWSSLVFSQLIKMLVRADKTVITIHDQISDQFLQQKFLALGLHFVDVIFTTGFEAASQLGKITPKKVIIQPSGVNEIFFLDFNRNFENKIFTVVTVANLLPKKNIELILKIAKTLKEFRFVLIGDGSHRKVIENIIQRDGVNNVELVGFKSAEIVRKYYYESDCYLLTSLSEGTPTSMLEAMACGLPIISSNAGGVKAILGKRNCVADLRNKQQFIDCLSKFSVDIKLRRDVSVENRIQSEKYTWKSVALNISRHLFN
ncbi:glycosyltransferase family 4 protein [Candidatus Thioglobus autotrophicus]|uniref:glycosyltransferase family 4 protein n=1 Tax=Candidatus Thioglobus autotrophicus TaxID=1705394 RepID=UPI00299CED84|nr:glycosyltransferase family 4 protein [Candidatus Thioglobus autotrophicus]WPE17692.1 glycosyltransferase family 4 protein [Candidatus Thioglobus autotrophicus]